jgi:hypothetical protein
MINKLSGGSMYNFNDEKERYESYFLNEGAVNYILGMDRANLEIQLEEAKKHCEIPARDADDLVNQIRAGDFLGVERESPWDFSSIPVLDYTGETHNFPRCQALFNLVNKWGYKRPYKYFQIVYSSDFLVVWFGDVLVGGPIFWLSTGNVIYKVIYYHKELRLYPNICTMTNYVAGLDETSLDNVVKKYYKSLRYFDPKFKILAHASGYKTIELDKYFRKGFFYKGPKYNYTEYKYVNHSSVVC